MRPESFTESSMNKEMGSHQGLSQPYGPITIPHKKNLQKLVIVEMYKTINRFHSGYSCWRFFVKKEVFDGLRLRLRYADMK